MLGACLQRLWATCATQHAAALDQHGCCVCCMRHFCNPMLLLGGCVPNKLFAIMVDAACVAVQFGPVASLVRLW